MAGCVGRIEENAYSVAMKKQQDVRCYVRGAPYTLRGTSSSTVIVSIGDPEVLHDRFELILCGQAGIQQVTAFRLPLMETAVVEHLEVIRDNERHDVVPQTLFEEKKPPDPSVSIRRYHIETPQENDS